MDVHVLLNANDNNLTNELQQTRRRFHRIRHQARELASKDLGASVPACWDLYMLRWQQEDAVVRLLDRRIYLAPALGLRALQRQNAADQRGPSHIPPVSGRCRPASHQQAQSNATPVARKHQTPRYSTASPTSYSRERPWADANADVIIRCGVHFMAETNSRHYLSMLIPDSRAGSRLTPKTSATQRRLRPTLKTAPRRGQIGKHGHRIRAVGYLAKLRGVADKVRIIAWKEKARAKLTSAELDNRGAIHRSGSAADIAGHSSYRALWSTGCAKDHRYDSGLSVTDNVLNEITRRQYSIALT